MIRCRFRTSLGFLAIVAVLPITAGVGFGVPPRAGMEGTLQAEAERSHEQMKRRLAEIARETPHDRFFGAAVPRIRAAVEQLPSGAPPGQRAQALGVLANAMLQAGDTEGAVSRLREVRSLLQSMARPAPGMVMTAEFLLGVAHLHLARGAICHPAADPGACLLPVPPAPGGPQAADLERAMEHLGRVALPLPKGQPLAIAATWLLDIAAMFAGEYPEGIPADVRIEPSVFEPAGDVTRFRDVAPDAGLATMSQAGGAVVEDFDGDELLDVMVSSLDPGAQLRLFRNRGDGHFDEITAEAGLEGILGGLNLVPGDYDSDGDVDVLVLRGAWLGERGRWPNSLLRNEGGHFLDVALAVGLEPHYPTQAAAWADYDGDGDLDLYVANEAAPGQPYPGQLFENRGGSFVDVAAVAGVENLRFGKGVTWGDFDGDGDPDLYVSNMGQLNRLYRNDGDGTFTDIASSLGVAGPRDSFMPWFWDVNNDGHLDLLVNAYEKAAEAGEAPLVWTVAAARMAREHDAPVPSLYLGDGQGGFEDVAADAGIAIPTLPMGVNFGDLDNDGWLDFYLGTGYPGLEGLVPNVMYRNVDGRRFEEVTFAGGFGHLAKGHGIAFADLDHDGDQDVFEQMGGLLPGDGARDVLYENPGTGNHWLKLRLVASDGRTAYGARVELRVEDGSGPRSIYRWVGSVAGFGGNPRRLEIGLGAATRVRVLEIRWPGAEEPRVLTDLDADRFYEVRQDDATIHEIPLDSFRFPRPE